VSTDEVRDAGVEPLLDEALAALRSRGFAAAADTIEAAMRTAATSSSEILGEISVAIREVERRSDPPLPRGLKRLLQRCHRRVRSAWRGQG
jgi:hypothetical protein